MKKVLLPMVLGALILGSSLAQAATTGSIGVNCTVASHSEVVVTDPDMDLAINGGYNLSASDTAAIKVKANHTINVKIFGSLVAAWQPYLDIKVQGASLTSATTISAANADSATSIPLTYGTGNYFSDGTAVTFTFSAAAKTGAGSLSSDSWQALASGNTNDIGSYTVEICSPY